MQRYRGSNFVEENILETIHQIVFLINIDGLGYQIAVAEHKTALNGPFVLIAML